MRGMKGLVVLGIGILLSSSGCCGFLHNGGCGCDNCGDGGTMRRPYQQRVNGDSGCGCNSCGTRAAAPACGSCGSCDSCGECCDDGCQRNFCFHPLRAIGRLFTVGTWCGEGCGCGNETYSEGGPHVHRSGCASCNHGGGYENGESMEGEQMQGEPAGVPTPAPARPAPAKATRLPAYNDYDR